jgi:hypothetical protein
MLLNSYACMSIALYLILIHKRTGIISDSMCFILL